MVRFRTVWTPVVWIVGIAERRARWRKLVRRVAQGLQYGYVTRDERLKMRSSVATIEPMNRRIVKRLKSKPTTRRKASK